MARTRGWARATGWWSRRTRATAASCGSTARSRSSPTSIPSISTITAASTRSKDAFVEFVENVPFYGAALLCLDHPEVQAIMPRVRDRRIVTYGFSAQADVRGVNVTPYPGGNRFEAIVRQRDGTHAVDRAYRAADARAPQCPERAGRDRRRAGTGHRRCDDPAAASPSSAGSSGASPRSARCDRWRQRTIIDDYGHHPVEIRAVLAAARESVAGPRDRGGPAASLFAARQSDGGLPDRVQRCRPRAGDAGLCRGRSAGRGGRCRRRWSRG